MALTSAITPTFTSADWTKVNATTAEYATRVSIPMSASGNACRTAVGYDLTNSSISFKHHAFSTGSQNFELRASNAAADCYRVIGNSTNTGVFNITNGTTTSVTTMTNAVGKANPYWRWRHVTGTGMIFEASPDAAFSTIGYTYTIASPAKAITNLFVYFYQNQSGGSGTWTVQELNGAADPAGAAAARFQKVHVHQQHALQRASRW